MKRVLSFIQNEIALVLAALAAVCSMPFVPPDAEYIGYIDFNVLALLFSLMIVIAGITKLGVFEVLSQRLISKAGSLKRLALILVLLCFFFSMLITNDVALLTFIPFTVMVLRFAGEERLVYVITLQTVAANLGSMLTPMGNPQNLYLYSYFGLDATEFFKITLPIVGVSALMIVACTLLIKNRQMEVCFAEKAAVRDKKRLALYLALFAVCLLAVLKIIHYGAAFIVVLAAVLLADRSLLRRVDYALLLTFVCFFIFVGNLGRIEAVRALVSSLIAGKELLFSAGLSQIISNVPAAVMLSGFTQNYKALIAGTNIGGLGTLIASLASLISFKLYTKNSGARPALYMGVFTGINALFLAVLLLFGSALAA